MVIEPLLQVCTCRTALQFLSLLGLMTATLDGLACAVPHEAIPVLCQVLLEGSSDLSDQTPNMYQRSKESG